MLELKNPIVHYKKDLIILKDRVIDFEGLKNIIPIKIKGISQNIKIKKYKRVNCVNCKIDTHRAS